MKILLINNNPVVSRLTALSARKENVSLDEIKNISELKASNYNIIFVDGESYNNDVSNIIRNSGVEQKVLFYGQGEEIDQTIFTQSILKPFLPSEVSEVLRTAKVTLLNKKTEDSKEKQVENVSSENPSTEKPSGVNFQELVEESKNKELELLNIGKKKEEKETSTTTEKLISQEKDIVEKIHTTKDEFDLKIEEAFPLSLEDTKEPVKESKKGTKETSSHEKDMFDLNSELFELDDKKESNPKTPMESDLFEIDEKKEGIKDTENNTLFEIDKGIKENILSDEPLDFDPKSKEEVSFSPTEEKSTKIIPQTEASNEETKIEKPEITTKVLNDEDISNIKDILEEKEGSENLTAIPTSLMNSKPNITEEKKSDNVPSSLESQEQEVAESKAFLEEQIQKKKKKKKKESEELTTGDAIALTLSKLPIKDLRRLLRGAKINISIEFPNEI